MIATAAPVFLRSAWFICQSTSSFSREGALATTTATATRTSHFNVKKVWQTLKNETGLNGARFREENENLSSSANVLPKTSNLVISRSCFADDGKEIEKNEKMHVQSVQRYCFCSLNMQICDVLVAVAVVVAKAP